MAPSFDGRLANAVMPLTITNPWPLGLRLAVRYLTRVSAFPALLFVSVFAEVPARAQACAGPENLGTLSGIFSQAYGVSADGRVVVGSATVLAGHHHAFRWDSVAGLQDMGTLGGNSSTAVAVSADGNVIVGNASLANGDISVFRWTQSGGMQEIVALGGTYAHATAVSSDGTAIVGWFRPNVPSVAAASTFLWTATVGVQDLGSLGGDSAQANAVSADGGVVVGYSTTAAGDTRAYRWTAAGGMQDLGMLPGDTDASARGVSDDGTVVVGVSVDRNSSSVSHPFRWTAAGGMEQLDLLGGSFGSANAISADGRVVVGRAGLSGSASGVTFVRWTADGAVQEFGNLESIEGLSASPNALSADGSVVVGRLWTNMSRNAAFRVQSSILGTTYCRPSVSNSTGCGGTVLAEGSPLIAAGSLELTATLLPQNSFGFFATSRLQGFTANAGGSQGNLCLGLNIGRFTGPGQVMNSGPDGRFTLTVDLNALPQPSGGVAAQPGQTWNFQAWHRDSNPTSASNFTDAVSITFE